jgi:hypothetical protein
MPTMTSTADAALPVAGRIGYREDRENPRRPGDSRTEREERSRYVRSGPRCERALTLEVAAREYTWLYDHRHGIGYEEIAARENVSVDRVKFGVKRSRAQESKLSKDDLMEELKPGRVGDVGFRLIPLFPIVPFTPPFGLPAPRVHQARLKLLLHGLSRFRDGQTPRVAA